MTITLSISSFFDIPLVIDSKNLPSIIKRLEAEQFSFVEALTSTYKEKLRAILRDFFNKKIDYEQAIRRTTQEIVPPATYKRTKRWDERLVRTEASKIFTLGYGDYLLSLGETECYIPHTEFDESKDCLRVIAGGKFPIKLIQDNIYKNYDLKKPIHPTVPLHANCRYIITKIS